MEDHNGLCNANKTDGSGKCKRLAGFGTDHPGFGRCMNHGGTTESHRVSAARAQARKLAEEYDTDPSSALLYAVRLAAGAVEYIRGAIEDGSEEDGWRLARIYGEERDRLAKTAAMALNAGIAERAVRVAESQGRALAGVIQAVLGELQLTVDQQALVPGVVRAKIAELMEAGVIDG